MLFGFVEWISRRNDSGTLSICEELFGAVEAPSRWTAHHARRSLSRLIVDTVRMLAVVCSSCVSVGLVGWCGERTGIYVTILSLYLLGYHSALYWCSGAATAAYVNTRVSEHKTLVWWINAPESPNDRRQSETWKIWYAGSKQLVDHMQRNTFRREHCWLSHYLIQQVRNRISNSRNFSLVNRINFYNWSFLINIRKLLSFRSLFVQQNVSKHCYATY